MNKVKVSPVEILMWLSAIVIVLMVVLFFTGCTDEPDTRHTLQSAGFSEITITGWSPMSCGQDDTYSTGFRAKNPKGEMVEGTVCCGLVMKACTIRF